MVLNHAILSITLGYAISGFFMSHRRLSFDISSFQMIRHPPFRFFPFGAKSIWMYFASNLRVNAQVLCFPPR